MGGNCVAPLLCPGSEPSPVCRVRRGAPRIALHRLAGNGAEQAVQGCCSVRQGAGRGKALPVALPLVALHVDQQQQ